MLLPMHLFSLFSNCFIQVTYTVASGKRYAVCFGKCIVKYMINPDRLFQQLFNLPSELILMANYLDATETSHELAVGD